MEGLFSQMPTMNWEANDLETSWKSFQQHAEFVFSGPLKAKTEVEKCSYLMIWVGEKGRNIYSTWSDFSADDKKELSKYYGRFENYVKPRSNEVYNRYKFQTRSQNDPESFDQFVTELKLLVKDCRYHPEEVNKVVRDRIVIGVRSNKIREKIINVGSDLTLEKAIELSQVYEMSSSQAKSIAGNIEDSSVHAVKVKHKKHDKGQGSRNKLYDKGKKSVKSSWYC